MPTKSLKSHTRRACVKIDLRFPKQVLLTLLVVGVVSAFPLVRFASQEVIVAAIAGAFLGTLNVLAGYVAIEYAIDKSYMVLLKTVVGGMGARMVLVLGILIALIKLFDFHAIALSVSLLGFYIVFSILEVLFIQKKLNLKNQG